MTDLVPTMSVVAPYPSRSQRKSAAARELAVRMRPRAACATHSLALVFLPATVCCEALRLRTSRFQVRLESEENTLADRRPALEE